MKTLRSLLFILLWPIAAWAQKIENVDFKIKDNVITVTYDLTDCPKNYVYDVKVKFKSDAGDYVYPKNAYGDLKEVTQGTGKSITWNVLSDNQQLKGNISAIVEIDDRHYIAPRRERLARGKVQGGPSNAFLSMLLPGLGDYFVNKYSANEPKQSSYSSGYYGGSSAKVNPSTYWYIFPAAYYLCMFGAIGEYGKYKQSYSDYHGATSQSYMDIYYDAAATHYSTTQTYLGLAASAWLCDVIHVAVKGYKNKHRQMKRVGLNESKTSYYFVGTGQNFQIGLFHKL